MKTLLVPKEIAQRWGVDLRTVRRRRYLLRMKAEGFTGSVPMYTEDEVRRAERAWLRHMRGVLKEQSDRARKPRAATTTPPAQPAPVPEAEPRMISMEQLRRARLKARQ